MKRLVIWIIDETSDLMFLAIVIGGGFAGYYLAELCWFLTGYLGWNCITEYSRPIFAILGVIIGFAIGVSVFGLLFILMMIERNTRNTKEKLDSILDYYKKEKGTVISEENKKI